MHYIEVKSLNYLNQKKFNILFHVILVHGNVMMYIYFFVCFSLCAFYAMFMIR